jgi:hypothetical protein
VTDRAQNGSVRNDDGLEVLDLGTLQDPAPSGSQPRPSRRAVLALGGAAVVGAGLTALTRGGSSKLPPPDAAPVPDGEVVVTDLGRPLVGGPPLDVFGFTQLEVVRVELATGRITRTGLGGMESLDVVPVRGGVLVHSSEDGRGFFVPDDQPPRRIASTFGRPGPLLRGPDLDHVWVVSEPDPKAPMELVTLDGRPTLTGVTGSVRPTSYPVPDGGGYLLVAGVSGTYWIGRRGPHRVTTGVILADGPTGWLVLEADGAGRRGGLLVERAGGRRPVPFLSPDAPTRGEAVVGGTLSPDGRRAALYAGDPARPLRLEVVDLATGAAVPTGVRLFPGAVLRSPRWSPDGRLVVSVDNWGRVVAVDTATGWTGPLVPEDVLPGLEDVAIRA